VRMTIGSKQKTWSSVFSVTHRSRKPSASARCATRRSSPISIGSGERCGSDMPNSILSFNAIDVSSVAIAPVVNSCCPMPRSSWSFRGAAQRRARNPYSRVRCSWIPGPAFGRPGMTHAGSGDRLNLLDDFHLRAVGALDPAHVAAVVVDFLEDLRAVLLQLRKRAGVIVGLQCDVLDAVTLLMVLGRDDYRDIKLQPMQIKLEAAPRHLALQGRAEIVDIKLRRRLGVRGLDMDVSDFHGHARLLRSARSEMRLRREAWQPEGANSTVAAERGESR